MYKVWKNKIVAIVLLSAFSLNTLAGFACSIGIDMGYNNKHHRKEASCCRNKHKTSNSYTAKHLAFHETNRDCCSGDVAQFTLLDKSVVSAYSAPQLPFFPLTGLSSAQAITDDEQIASPANLLCFVRRSRFTNDTDNTTATRSLRI